MYFHKVDTWNTSCTPAKSGGRETLYATRLTLSVTLNGSMNHGFSFLFLPNRTTPFIGKTFKNTWSPASNLTLCFACSLSVFVSFEQLTFSI
jgi:hypothetical protein